MNKRIFMFFVVCLCFIFTGGCAVFQSSQGENALHEGIIFFNKGDCENAQIKFEEAVQREPKLCDGYYYMAECALRKDDFQRTLQLSKSALARGEKDEKNVDKLKKLFLMAGQQAYEKKDYDTAIVFLQECLSLGQKDSTAHLWLGKMFLERGGKTDMKTAIAEFKAALEKSENIVNDTKQIRDILFARAQKYSLQGDIYTESRCYLAYTENFDKNDVEALIVIGNIFFKMGNPIGALYHAERAYDLEPNNKEVMKLLDHLNSPMH